MNTAQNSGRVEHAKSQHKAELLVLYLTSSALKMFEPQSIVGD